MSPTAPQLATLKADIAANTNTVLINGTPTQIKLVPASPDNAAAVAAWYNQAAAGPYRVWDTAASLKAIRAAVDLSKYTPSDSVPNAGSTTTVTNDQLVYQNRALACQLKQANATILIQGPPEATVDCTGQQFRQSFSDCMTLIPSGVSGASTNAGWGTAGSPGAVRLAMQRPATNVEKLFSAQAAPAPAAGNVSTDPRGSTTNPDALVVVGPVDPSDVLAAMSP
jgi:hypothetical protein